MQQSQTNTLLDITSRYIRFITFSIKKCTYCDLHYLVLFVCVIVWGEFILTKLFIVKIKVCKRNNNITMTGANQPVAEIL